MTSYKVCGRSILLIIVIVNPSWNMALKPLSLAPELYAASHLIAAVTGIPCYD
jgi:hypothetical protein